MTFNVLIGIKTSVEQSLTGQLVDAVTELVHLEYYRHFFQMNYKSFFQGYSFDSYRLYRVRCQDQDSGHLGTDCSNHWTSQSGNTAPAIFEVCLEADV